MPIERLKRPHRIDEERMEQLKKIMPEVFSDGVVDFNVLKQVITGVEDIELDINNETYGLQWTGKSQARRLSFVPPTGTLKFASGLGFNEEKTKNFLIEGDNLEVLRVLRKSYQNRLKLVYIDPPYNTGSDFIYSDDFKEPLDKYLIKSGQADEEGLLTSNPKSSGRFHANWLNMIYPRLRLARDLLRKDGLIVVHLDENEEYNLEIIMNEIFGEDNNLGKIIWDKRNPKGDSTGIAYQHEVILVFAKDKGFLLSEKEIKRPKANAEKMLKKASELFAKLGTKTYPNDLEKLVKKYGLPNTILTNFEQEYDLELINKEFKAWVNAQDYLSGGESAYNNIDGEGNVYRPVSMAWPNKKKAPDEYFIPLIHPVTGKHCPVPNRGWRNPPETMKRLLNENKILFGPDETTIPNRKYLLKENMYENVPSIIRYGASDDAFFNKIGLSFDNPKPYRLSADIISYFTEGDDIVLDFFAGSGTTGHAVLEANRRDGGNRNFILVQIPERVDNNLTIVDITRERLIKSINIMNEEDDNEQVVDRGFAVYKLEKSNLKIWNPSSVTDIQELEQNLDLFTNNKLVEGWTPENIVTELLLLQGYPLDSVIAKVEADSNGHVWTVFHESVPYKMVINLEKDINDKAIEQVLNQYSNDMFICFDDAISDGAKTILAESMKVKTI